MGRAQTGRTGEDAACRYLTEQGHTILERNWRWSHLEIDIISLDAEGLHFVEVKSRTAPVSTAPEDNVTFRKQKRLAAAALAFLNERQCGGLEVFFDIISVVFDGGRTDLTYFKQAFIPIYT